jgi:3-oxoadipate enol-lactonase
MAGMELMVPVAGGSVWAQDTGGDGPPVVLLHPGIADSRCWDPVLPRLRQRYRVIRYDVRGYGRSPVPTVKYSLRADLAAVLDHFGLARVSLVGCSMGGGTAIDLALADPGRVSSLVLLCPGISGYPWPEDEALGAEMEALAQARDMDGLAAVGMRLWAGAGGGIGADPEVETLMRAAVPAWFLEEEFQDEDPPAYDRLGEIGVPTVMLVGDEDRPEMVECDELAAARIPGCRVVRVPGVDHLPSLRVPDLVAGLVEEYC